MNLKQMTEYVIDPALKAVDLYSPQASRLILLTGMVESRYEYVAQVGGPARSFWQVEPETASDHFDNYLHWRVPLLDQVKALMLDGESIETNLALNMGFAVVMARLVYRRNKMALPMVDDLAGQAYMWKKVYNTPLGAGTEEKFIEICQGLDI